MGNFIHIRSTKFPVLAGEDDEIVNDGMYGKALSQYLQQQLTARGYDVPFFCAEDWGWWVEIKGLPIKFGVCVYSAYAFGTADEFVCVHGATDGRSWSWSKFRFIDNGPWIGKLNDDLLKIFSDDPDVQVIGVTDDFPF
jgi:hypothetical protein